MIELFTLNYVQGLVKLIKQLFSLLNYYSIKELENYSGIKAHTIRMWEKRYKLLDPSRTNTNIRYYDDNQLIKLLNTVTLLESGWKISKVSQLSQLQLIESTTKCFELNKSENFLIPINSMITAMFGFDELGFGKVIDACIQKIGLNKTVNQIIYPFLNRVGMMWRLHEISPAQEHFASNIIRQKMISTINALPQIQKDPADGIVLFLPDNEFHELGLLVANYLIKQKGNLKSYYLGCNTPLQSLEVLVKKCSPKILFTFIITRKPFEQTQSYIHSLSQKFPSQQIWIAAHKSIFRHFNQLPDNIKVLNSMEELEVII